MMSTHSANNNMGGTLMMVFGLLAHGLIVRGNIPVSKQTTAVPENTPQHTTLLVLEHRLSGNCENESLTFALDPSTSFLPRYLFLLNKTTGAIILKEVMLDYESNKQHDFKVNAFSSCNIRDPLYAVHVQVSVLDVNDNHPQLKLNGNKYTQNIAVFLKENGLPGKSVVNIEVTDEDSGRNAEADCSINLNDTFSIERSSDKPIRYEISTRVSFDREKDTGWFVIDIICRDRGNPSLDGTGRVRVAVVDLNDNSPLIEVDSASENGVIEVPENENWKKRVRVQDLDYNENSHLTCTINTPTFGFTLEQMTAPLETYLYPKSMLDYEEKIEYHITINCTDMGNPPLSTVKNYTIRVTDQNDFPPKIKIHTQTASGQVVLKENEVPGTMIAYVSVYDPDSVMTALTCTINDNDFTLTRVGDPTVPDFAFYKIETARSLDYEENSIRGFSLECNDNGTPPKKSAENITVHLSDTNDNSPELKVYSLSNKAEIKQSQEPGVVVAKISVKDVDTFEASGQVECSVENENFKLQPNGFSPSGEYRILSKKALVLEENNYYEILIECHDTGISPKRVTRTIVISVIE